MYGHTELHFVSRLKVLTRRQEQHIEDDKETLRRGSVAAEASLVRKVEVRTLTR